MGRSKARQDKAVSLRDDGNVASSPDQPPGCHCPWITCSSAFWHQVWHRWWPGSRTPPVPLADFPQVPRHLATPLPHMWSHHRRQHAHCLCCPLHSWPTKGWFQVVAGAHNIHTILPEDTIQKRKVADMWKHEGYDSSIITNDVSLLKLDEPLEFNEYVQPLPMAPKGDDPAGGTICVNSGWGSTSHSSITQMPNKLQFVEMPIVSRPDYQEDYSRVNGVDEGMICGGIDEGGISACSGDSGGPFACPNENGTLQLSGIVSWGMIPCGQANRPSVFTSVGYFRDWIDEHLAL